MSGFALPYLKKESLSVFRAFDRSAHTNQRALVAVPGPGNYGVMDNCFLAASEATYGLTPGDPWSLCRFSPSDDGGHGGA
jgi:hypothetical protein